MSEMKDHHCVMCLRRSVCYAEFRPHFVVILRDDNFPIDPMPNVENYSELTSFPLM